MAPLDETVGRLWQEEAAQEKDDGWDGSHTQGQPPPPIAQVLCACTDIKVAQLGVLTHACNSQSSFSVSLTHFQRAGMQTGITQTRKQQK